MAYKHQAESFRKGGEWVCWSEGLRRELTLKVVESIRAQGLKVRREADQVFVRAEDVFRITPFDPCVA